MFDEQDGGKPSRYASALGTCEQAMVEGTVNAGRLRVRQANGRELLFSSRCVQCKIRGEHMNLAKSQLVPQFNKSHPLSSRCPTPRHLVEHREKLIASVRGHHSGFRFRKLCESSFSLFARMDEAVQLVRVGFLKTPLYHLHIPLIPASILASEGFSKRRPHHQVGTKHQCIHDGPSSPIVPERAYEDAQVVHLVRRVEGDLRVLLDVLHLESEALMKILGDDQGRRVEGLREHRRGGC